MNKAASAALMGLVLMMVAPACGGDHLRARAPATLPFVSVDPASGSPTDRAIADAQKRLHLNANDDEARLALAVAFLQKVRETADPTLYLKAQGLLDDLASRRADNPTVIEARGTLALAQHRFEDALELGNEALRLAPDNATALGILVDANNELGRYDDALEATQRMVDTRPSLASYSRVSYARELRGDFPGAIEAMQQAVSSAGSTGGENLAYVETLLGQLLLTTGKVTAADRAFTAAEHAFPNFPAALAGHAQVLVARDQFSAAADVLTRVVKVQPLAQYAIAYGDALSASGRDHEAARAYELVDVISKLFQANGVRLDLETVLFDADHHPGNSAVDRARRALRDRPSGRAHDALAWNLYQVGSFDAAAKESQRALALGGRDPQEQFHAAAIAFAQGNRVNAIEHLRTVLTENPRFNARLIPKIASLARSLDLAMPKPLP